MFAVAAFLTGEGLVFTGLWWAWPPLALVVTGLQVLALGLLRETGGKRGGRA